MKTDSPGRSDDGRVAPDGGAALREALDLLDLGCAMWRQQLRRAYPEVTDAEIDEMVIEWHRSRPLDAPGPRKAFIPTSSRV